ncbi:MAG: trigger factor [Chloroflexi bacterium]|nr:trigger factor [Chloroflexota bacterium]MBM3174446.1 trigger factor [Chloroflexota bacterium]MBM4449602.1 trigger factor [Chloroflexota bacterium]
MKVSSEPMENSQVALRVEMEKLEVEKYLEKAYLSIARRVTVPGFRKGKAPKSVMERHVGKETILQEALEQMISKAYEEALGSQNIEAIDRPEIELLQTEPVVFKAIVPIKPTVKLGNYKKTKIKPKPVEVNEKDVEATIEQLRRQHATLVPVERSVQFGDLVTIDVEGKREGEPFPIGKGVVYEVNKDSRLPLPGFAENLVGLDKDKDKSFVLCYPADHEIAELAGKEYEFKVLVAEIKEKQLPEANDDFAKGLGLDDLASLREQILNGLKQGADEKARLELEQKATDALVESSKVEYPPILVERAIDRLLSEEAENFRDGFEGLERYLASLNKSMETHRGELKPIAEKRVVRTLVLEKVAEEEAIEVEEVEVDAEIDKMSQGSGEQAENMKKVFNLPQARDSIKRFLKSKKAVECLVKIATNSA